MASLDDYWPYKEAITQLELILDAAASVPEDPSAWGAVEKALGALLDRVVGMIIEMASNPELGILPRRAPTFQEMRDTLDKVDESGREPTDRALTFIENWLKQDRARRKKIQIRERRNRAVLDMYAEMEKGLSRSRRWQTFAAPRNRFRNTWVRSSVRWKTAAWTYPSPNVARAVRAASKFSVTFC